MNFVWKQKQHCHSLILTLRCGSVKAYFCLKTLQIYEHWQNVPVLPRLIINEQWCTAVCFSPKLSRVLALLTTCLDIKTVSYKTDNVFCSQFTFPIILVWFSCTVHQLSMKDNIDAFKAPNKISLSFPRLRYILTRTEICVSARNISPLFWENLVCDNEKNAKHVTKNERP